VYLIGFRYEFHRKNLVHGDLRDVNIICKEDKLRQGRDLIIRKEDDRRVLRYVVSHETNLPTLPTVVLLAIARDHD